jgi:hypothetical protein
MRIVWGADCVLYFDQLEFYGGSVVITYSILGVLLAVEIMTIYIWSIKRPRDGKNNDKHHAKHHEKS